MRHRTHAAYKPAREPPLTYAIHAMLITLHANKIRWTLAILGLLATIALSIIHLRSHSFGGLSSPTDSDPISNLSHERQKYTIETPSTQHPIATTRLRIIGNAFEFGQTALIRFETDSDGSVRIPLAWERPLGKTFKTGLAMHPFDKRIAFDEQGFTLTGLLPKTSYSMGAALWMFTQYAGEGENKRRVFTSLSGLADCVDVCMLALSEPLAATTALAQPPAPTLSLFEWATSSYLRCAIPAASGLAFALLLPLMLAFARFLAVCFGLSRKLPLDATQFKS